MASGLGALAAELRRSSQWPRRRRADVVAVVVLAGGFGLVAERVLINGNVALVAEMALDDVVQLDASGGPVKLQVSGLRLPTGLGRYRPAEHGCHVVAVVVLTGGLGLIVERVLIDADVVGFPRCSSTMSLRSTHVIGHSSVL